MQIEDLSLNDLRRPSVISIFGTRNTGKTTIIKSLLRYYSDYPTVVLSPTGLVDYQPDFPNAVIYTEKFNEALESLFLRQKRLHDKKTRKGDNFYDEDTHLVVAVDGNFYAGISSKKKNELIMNGRCYNITLIFSDQINDLQPALRDNLDYVFLSRNNNLRTQEKYYDYYFDKLYSTFDEFASVYNDATNNFGTLVFESTGRREKAYRYRVNLELINPVVENTYEKVLLLEKDGVHETSPEECSICLQQNVRSTNNTHGCKMYYCYECASRLRNVCCICTKIISEDIEKLANKFKVVKPATKFKQEFNCNNVTETNVDSQDHYQEKYLKYMDKYAQLNECNIDLDLALSDDDTDTDTDTMNKLNLDDLDLD